MKHKITKTKIKSIHFYDTLCVTKKREIQYFAMIRMGGFCVLPMQKLRGFCLRGFCLRGFYPPTMGFNSLYNNLLSLCSANNKLTKEILVLVPGKLPDFPQSCPS